MASDDSGDPFRGIMDSRREKARENAAARREADAEIDALAHMGIVAGETATLPNPIDGKTFINKIDAPMEWAIKPLLPRGEVIEVNGGHGRLKSTLVLSWCLSVATGRDWGGFPVTKGKVCFVSMEDRERIIRARVQAWIGGITDKRERAQAWKDLEENFSCLAREQSREYAVTQVEKGKIVRVLPVVQKLKELAKDHVLVVLETTARLHGGEEDNAGLIMFGLAVEEIATDTGAAVVIIRHQSKSDARAQSTDSYSGRGGGALADATRAVFVVTRPDVSDPKERDLRPIVLTHSKASIGAPQPPSYWKPEEVTLPNGDKPVFLRLMTKNEIGNAIETKIINEIRETFPEGIKRDDLIRELPSNERGKARGVIETLTKRGTILEVQVPNERGKGKPARMYRLPEWNLSVIEGGK